MWFRTLSLGEKKKGIFNSLKKKKKGRKNFLSRSLTHISELRSSRRRSDNFDLKDELKCETAQAQNNNATLNANQNPSHISLGQAPESPNARPENLSFEGESAPVEFSPGSTVSLLLSYFQDFRFVSYTLYFNVEILHPTLHKHY